MRLPVSLWPHGNRSTALRHFSTWISHRNRLRFNMPKANLWLFLSRLFLYHPSRNQTLESSLTFSLPHLPYMFLHQVPWSLPSQYLSNPTPSHHGPLHHLLWSKLTAPLTWTSTVASELVGSPPGTHSALPWPQSILFKIQVWWSIRYTQLPLRLKILDAVLGTYWN